MSLQKLFQIRLVEEPRAPYLVTNKLSARDKTIDFRPAGTQKPLCLAEVEQQVFVSKCCHAQTSCLVLILYRFVSLPLNGFRVDLWLKMDVGLRAS